MRRRRLGGVLLEVVVALTVFGVSGTLLLSQASAVADAQYRIILREKELMEASSVLAEIVTLERSELVIRIGRRAHDPFVVLVDRPEPALFRIAISSAAAPEVELLTTALYRPSAGGER